MVISKRRASFSGSKAMKLMGEANRACPVDEHAQYVVSGYFSSLAWLLHLSHSSTLTPSSPSLLTLRHPVLRVLRPTLPSSQHLSVLEITHVAHQRTRQPRFLGVQYLLVHPPGRSRQMCSVRESPRAGARQASQRPKEGDTHAGWFDGWKFG